ncbi:MAG: Ig-like domain-containing protein [Paludibacter sp.]|nr:Ig-like domain-containing protein [Paludibacter sp.]
MKKTTSWDYAPENYPKQKASAFNANRNQLTTKFLMLLLLFVGVSVSGWGQTTIVFNGAETSGTTWVTSSNSFTSSTTNTGTPADRIKSGSYSFQKSGSSATLITNSASTAGYTDCFVEIWTASISVNASNGADNGDDIKVYVSSTSTFSSTPDLVIDGTNNLRYGMSGTGSVTTVSGTAITYDYPSGGTKNSTDAKSKLVVTIPNNWETVYLKIVSLNNDANEIWCIDDISLKGTVVSTTTSEINLSDNGTQVTTSNVNQGTTAHVLHKFQLSATETAATLTGLSCSTTGTYVASDITNLKLRYSTDATLDAGDATLSTYSNPGAAGAKTFPSFTNRSIAKDATGYFFITADVAANATHNNTIGIEAITTDNLTFSSGNKSGSTNAGGLQTFKDVTAPTVSSFNPTDGSTSVTVNQNLIITFNENIKVGTSGSVDIYNTEGLFESIPYNDERLTISTNTLTVNPTGTFAYSSNYYVQIGANVISDLYDNNYIGISNTTTWNFTTECGPESLPYSQNFESVAVPAIPTCNTIENAGTGNNWVTVNNPGSGFTTNTLKYGFNSSNAANAWYYTSGLNLEGGKNYTLSFKYGCKQAAYPEKLKVMYGTSASNTSMSNALYDNGNVTNVTPNTQEINFTPASTGVYYIGFNAYSAKDMYDLYVDDITVDESATCLIPTAVTASSVTATTATISWTASTSNPSNGYQYEVRTSGAAGSGSTGLAVSGSTAEAMLSTNISGLEANTSYNVYVRSNCGGDDFSAWTTMYSFNTPNLAAPTATAATDITANCFTATWNSVSGATSYELSVYTKTGVVASEKLRQEFTWTENSTGGNDGAWSGTVASATKDMETDLANWTFSNAYKGDNCIKMGSGSKQGVLTSPVLGFTGDATLTFRAGAWDGDQTSLLLEISDGGSLSVSSVEMLNAAFSNYSVSIIGATTSTKITFKGKQLSKARFFLDDVVITQGGTTLTPIAGSPFTVTGTNSKAISGLTQGTEYFYTVVAKRGAETSAASNEISASTTLTNIEVSDVENASTLPDCPTCDLVVTTGGKLTMDADKTFNSVTVAPGAKLTLADTKTLTGALILQSNTNASATFIDENASPASVTATVQQHLPAATDRTWWYLASPVTGAASSVFGSNKVGDYSETTRSYSNPFTEATTLTAGKGYVVKMTAASAANYVFENKTLNTGDISVLLTRTVTETADNAKRGFNLVGNPYPSYLNWELVYAASTNIRSTIWYRTLDKGSMAFYTYNAKSNISVPDSAHGYIPPMQAFWVKVDTDPVSPATVSNGTLNFTNDMRSHDESALGNPLKAPAADRNLVRLSISNGTLSDETVIVTHPSASDNYDSYDSEKMANGDANRPEIFSMAGNQELVINGISPLTDSKQIALGVRPGLAGNYTIALTEWRNISDMDIVLRDNQLGEELLLTESNNYSFSTDGNTSKSRFSLLFRAKESTTGFDRISSDLLIYSTQNTIRVESASLEGNTISIFNALGQPVFSGKAQSNRLEINGLTPAVYMVKVNNQTKMVIVK